MARRRRRAGPITRRYRRAKRDMRLNRIGARFISGGKHQTFTSIVTSPWKVTTVTNSSNRRDQYRAHRERERKAAQAERRRRQREDAKARKQAAAAKKSAPRAPRKPRTPDPPIAVNPRTGKPITLREAMRSLKEAQDRAERLAAGLPGDPPAKKASAPRKKSATAPAARKAPARRRPAAKKGAPPAPPLPPLTAPGKNLRGLYLAATCPCQGTGRIYIERNGAVTGSRSCPEHGRTARGSRKIFSRRAMTDAGLPGLAGWLDAKYRRPSGNMDHKQQRAVRQSGRARYAGPTAPCGHCDEGIVNRALTEQLRQRYIGDLLEQAKASESKAPTQRKLKAAASRAYPYDRCRECKGLGVVPDPHAGEWLERAGLRAQHWPTARELATGKVTPSQRR